MFYVGNTVIIIITRIVEDTDVMEGGLFPSGFKEELAPNRLVRRRLSLEGEALLPFSGTREDHHQRGQYVL